MFAASSLEQRIRFGTLAWIGGALLASILIARWVVDSDMTGQMMVVLVMAVAIVGLSILGDWRVGLYGTLVWLILEDLPRKFLGNNMVIYFGKDLLIGAAYLAFLVTLKRGQAEAFHPPFMKPLLIFVGLGFVQVFNPNSPSLVYGLLGIKLYFYYIPLMFLGYALIRTELDLQRFLAFNLWMAGLVALLGVVQALVGPDFLNPAVTPEHLKLLRFSRVAPLSGQLVFRPSSVFVSDGRFAWYMLQSLILALGAVGYAAVQSRRRLRLWLAVLALIATAVALTGSRATILYCTASVVIFVAVLSFARSGTGRKSAGVPRLAAYIGLVIGIALLAALLLFPQTLGARWSLYYETISPWSPASELAYRTGQYPIREFLNAFSYPSWPIGYGIGTSSLGVQYLTSVFSLPAPGVGVESGYGAIVVEMGVIGLVAWLAWTVALVWSAWRAVGTLRGSRLLPVGFSIFWFAFVLLFPQTYGGLQPYHNFIFNAFMWLLVGVLFRLPELTLKGRTTELPRDTSWPA